MESRFQAEAKRGAYLIHANLAKIIDMGHLQTRDISWNNRPFYVMQIVQGISIDKLLERRAPSFRTRIEWLIQLADALSYLHEQQVCHRDIKPHNMLIRQVDSVLVLTDFGVVHWEDFASEYTDNLTTYASEVLSTWSYLAPEAEIQPVSYNFASDIWAFGKTALEILTWGFVSRAKLLINLTDFATIESSQLAELVKLCVDNDASKRPKMNKIAADLRRYLDILKKFDTLGAENQTKSIEAVKAYRPSVYEGYFRAYANRAWRKTALQSVRQQRTRPEDFRGEICDACGSQFTVLLASLDITPELDTAQFAFLNVCFGLPAKPCGNIWIVSYEN
jgi:serine/threonine protein kinase